MTNNTRLRELARAYASGQLNKAQYRQDRAKHIQAVLSGELELTVNKYPAPPGTGTSTDLTERKKKATIEKVSERVSEDIQATLAPPNKAMILAIGAGVALLLVVIAIWVFSGEDQDVTPAGRAGPQPRTVTETAPTAAQTLIKSFLDTRSWSTASMDAFVHEFQSLPQSVRESAANTVELGQLGNAIYKKLLEERALSSIGNPESSLEKQKMLVDFAENIGISDDRISLPENSATEEVTGAGNQRNTAEGAIPW